MTIFDSIRYPISDRVTLDELLALPVEIYYEWSSAEGYSIYSSCDVRMTTLGAMGQTQYDETIRTLRKIIRLWNT